MPAPLIVRAVQGWHQDYDNPLFGTCNGLPAMINLLDWVPACFAVLAPAAIAGALGVVSNGIWPLMRTRRQILGMQVLCSCLWALHYMFLGAHTAAAMCLAGAAQGVACTSLQRTWLRRGVYGATIAMSLAVTAATWSGLPSMLAQSGQLLSAFGRLQPGQQAIRLAFLGSEGFWVCHNLMVGSTWGLTADAMAVSTLLIGLWRGWSRHAARPAPTPARPAAA